MLERLQRKYRLSDKAIAAFRKSMRRVSYSKGDVVYHQGDDDGFFYAIESGEVAVTMTMPIEEEETDVYMKTLVGGDTSGFYSFLEDRPHGATLTCAQDTVAYRLDRKTFESILAADADLARNLLRVLSVKLQSVRHQFLRMQHRAGSPGPDKLLRVLCFDAKAFWKKPFQDAVQKLAHDRLQFTYVDAKLDTLTAYLAQGYEAVCCFVNDTIQGDVVEVLGQLGVRLLLMRCAGVNNVDVDACDALGISVANVPRYSPYAVAEHVLALLLSVNRKIHLAFNRVRDNNFTLDGLVGFDLHNKTIGVVGTGNIGATLVKLLQGFDCRILCYDVKQNDEVVALGGEYVELDEVLRHSDVVSLHVPLLKETTYMMNANAFAMMKKGAILINTSRGKLVDTEALMDALEREHLGGAGIDVFEHESLYFFEDWSSHMIHDDALRRLLTYKNVIVTSHQAFLTTEALDAITSTVVQSALEWQGGKRMGALEYSVNRVA